MVRRRVPIRSKAETKPKVLLPHGFRKHGLQGTGQCDSVYCQGFGAADVRVVRCIKCRNILHLDCLGIIFKNEQFSRFVCSGCRLKDKNSLTKQKYVLLTRKLRRHYTYVKMIVSGNFGSWRMRDYLKGASARRNLLYSASISFVSDDELDSMIEMFISWLTDWKVILDRSNIIKCSLDVLMPEALIRVIMDVENVHRDHAEHMFIRSRLELL